MNRRHDVIVVGAGILGLATARVLLRRRPGLRLLVLEKEASVGHHQSGHNSGVIHSGLYYQPGSLKAKLCLTGARLMTEFCDEHEIPYERCGKLIIASSESEKERLLELRRRGTANGVSGLEIVGPEGIRQIEPNARGLLGLYSPTTAIVDYATVTQVLAREVERLGGTIATSTPVRAISPVADGVVVTTLHDKVEAASLVSCGGLFSDQLARMTGGPADPRIVPFRGDYLRLKPARRSMVRGLIYPVPDPALPFLGVHTTRRLNGEIWLGPNAVLAFARAGYRFSNLSPRDLAATVLWPGFWRMARRYWQTSLGEMYRDLNRRAFVRELQRYLPELTEQDVEAGPSGVRAQALARNGTLVDDFVFTASGSVLHVRNAPSPGATSSLAIAAHIADELARAAASD
ncbi:MAG: L-2-hydroxyglutarate oxidase [Candidatus Dormibacteraeota bacterium]|nr:L-2-hydroxyglutarate oxidase [Candidatus Dormibacteraeota bacterium]